MTNTEFIMHEKSGINHITLMPSFKAEARHFGIIDGVLILAFLVSFVGLIFLLAK
jgi:hypothetical protein